MIQIPMRVLYPGFYSAKFVLTFWLIQENLPIHIKSVFRIRIHPYSCRRLDPDLVLVVVMVVVEHGRQVGGQVVDGLAVRSQVRHLLDRPRCRRYLQRHTGLYRTRDQCLRIRIRSDQVPTLAM